MASVRGMLTRVRKLEQARQAPASPIAVLYGSMDAFADAVQLEVSGGKLCADDMPVIDTIKGWCKWAERSL